MIGRGALGRAMGAGVGAGMGAGLGAGMGAAAAVVAAVPLAAVVAATEAAVAALTGAWARGLGTVAQCALRKRQSLCVIAPIRIRLSVATSASSFCR